MKRHIKIRRHGFAGELSDNNLTKFQPNRTLRAESPSIFLEKSGRGRRLCSWPALSLIRRSSKNMDESVQFCTGRTGLPLMRMLIVGIADCFRAHGILFTIDRQTSL